MTPAKMKLIQAIAANRIALREALEAIGCSGAPGYCFCANDSQAKRGHTGECREAQEALRLAHELDQQIKQVEQQEAGPITANTDAWDFTGRPEEK